MREELILLSSDGPHCNVLKLKPPMVFNHDNADLVVRVLDEVLQELRDGLPTEEIMHTVESPEIKKLAMDPSYNGQASERKISIDEAESIIVA